MPKMKTHRGAAKRFKTTGSGKLVKFHAYRSHKLAHKTARRKRNLRKDEVMARSDAQRVKKLVPYL